MAAIATKTEGTNCEIFLTTLTEAWSEGKDGPRCAW